VYYHKKDLKNNQTGENRQTSRLMVSQGHTHKYDGTHAEGQKLSDSDKKTAKGRKKKKKKLAPLGHQQEKLATNGGRQGCTRVF